MEGKCKRCGVDLVNGALYCHMCGKKQVSEPRKNKTRGNGQGSVYKLPNGKYKAVVVIGYREFEDGSKKKRVKTRTFLKKSDALAALPLLKSEPAEKKRAAVTFKALYDRWLPTHRAGKSTIDCYKAAIKYFKPIWGSRIEDIDIDDLQECVDTCGKGKRTQQNMKAVCGLVYKYGIPRNVIPNNLNLAQFLVVGGDGAAARESFTEKQIEQIRSITGKISYADYVYCLIYLGFRPSEFLSIDISQYDPERKCFIGGGKTAAGTNRIVTVSPKIQPLIDNIINNRTSGIMFCDANRTEWNLKEFTEKAFYPVLEAADIDNPIVEVGGGVKRHKYTPHSCRHTFATLMKRIDAPSKDKQELIGHTSEEMLKYYQDVDITDLRRITDLL